MAMAEHVKELHHILTLVIQKPADIPMVRKKVKLLTCSIGCSRRQVARFATAASELARILLTCCHGGKISLSFLRSAAGAEPAGLVLEFVFDSSGPCDAWMEERKKKFCAEGKNLVAGPPFLGVHRVFEEVEIEGGVGTVPLTIRCRRSLAHLPGTENLLTRIKAIRKDLFADTEESYMENLRAKHDEVLRLLEEKTEQNRMLDQSNNELLQLSNDLEALAQERTIIEMSLKIADQVRNPATVIGGLAGQLLRKGLLPEKAARKIQQIADQAERIDQIVHRFHAMADERRDLFVQEDLVLLVQDALQSCPTLGKRAIEPVFETGNPSVFIHANRRVLKVALIHVLRHAATVTPAGGRVIIRVDSDRKHATITVVDQGTGFSAEDLDELGHPSESSLQIGQPGLALVRHILAEHQGVLQVANSTEPGEGGRLVMRFPLIWREQGKIL